MCMYLPNLYSTLTKIYAKTTYDLITKIKNLCTFCTYITSHKIDMMFQGFVYAVNCKYSYS